MKLMIVDGSLLLCQMFFGIPNPIYHKNEYPIQGVYGFLGAFLKIKKILKATHAIVIFDGEHPNERQGVSADYKANRPDLSQDILTNPFTNIPLIYKGLDYLGIKYFETPDHEADDYIASTVKCFGVETVIVTKDLDLFQLIDEMVSVYSYRGKKSVLYDEETFYEKYMIKPSQLVDYKAIFGDKSDNISKVPGFGRVTTSRLLREYNDVSGIYQNLDLLPAKQKEHLLDFKELVYRNLELVKFIQVPPVVNTLEELKIRDNFDNVTFHECLQFVLDD